jgi:hypothetical protein
VLSRDGIGYLAAPNRWGPADPHFRLPLLSWLPSVELQSRYVRLARRGVRYDCRLPSRAELRSMFVDAGLESDERTLDALRVMGEIEDPSPAVRAISRAPDTVLRTGLAVVPTLVFTFRRGAERV